jgi:hypothetical protein
MHFQNATAAKAGWTLGFERDGRELLIVAVKGTYNIPQSGAEPALADEQAPLTLADEFTGEPGISAPLRETDFAHRKPFCDVLLNGTAYAARGRTVETLVVGLRVGSLVKTFEVIGNRAWRGGVVGVTPSRPQPFTAMPISYDNAFGGTDRAAADAGKTVTFERNPVGRGFAADKQTLVGTLVPNTQEMGRPVNDPSGAYVPMAFGPVGRNWLPRRRHAGTYDAAWLENSSPFWPDDFDYRYFQSAAEDQQTAYLAGGEPIVIQNLTRDGMRSFTVPSVTMPVMFIPKRDPDETVDAVIDTLLIEPDHDRFSVTWRASHPLKRDFFELRETIVGEMPQAWHRARRTALKRHYAGLGALIAAKRGPKQ